MQLNSGAKGSGSESQGVPLRPSPRAPLDDYCEAKREKVLNELPLQSFDLFAPPFVVGVVKGGAIFSSGEKRIARSLPSIRLASVVLPEPGKPHTIINLGALMRVI